MLVGIMSDSHGRAEMVRRAFALFDECGVRHVFHCGDVGGIDVLETFVGRNVDFVWGNCDFPDGGLRAFLDSTGVREPAAIPLEREIDGKRFAVFHGHERAFAHAESIEADYVLCGHSHQRRDEHVGQVRIINPGALHRANPKTVATLDTSTDELTFHEIADS